MLGRLSLTARLTALYTLVSACVLVGLGLLVSIAVGRHFVELDRDFLKDKIELVQTIVGEASSSEMLASRLDELQKEGLVRRIGPILDLRRMGRSGILAALAVPLDEADGVADMVSLYPEISHNYLRPNDSGYNLWFTVSGTEERIQDILQEIRAKTGRKMLVLPTLRIFKIGVKFDIV